MRWIVPLLLIGLVGCTSSRSFSGQWEGESDGNLLTMNVKPNGAWDARTVQDDGSAEAFSGTWVMESDRKAQFMERGASEPTEATLVDENRLVLRSRDLETEFQRQQSK